MKGKFPGFEKCMKMMRTGGRDGSDEGGFMWLSERASEFTLDFIREFNREDEPQNPRYWLMELIAEARDPRVFDFLKAYATHSERGFAVRAIYGLIQMNTRESRKFIRQMEMNEHEGSPIWISEVKSMYNLE